MVRYILFVLVLIGLLNINFTYAKGFSGLKGFKSYKSYKTPSKKSTLDHSFNKVKKKPKNPSSIFHAPWFKWFIGGLFFGAILSFLMGHGFHIGMPGLLEIILIAFLIYFLYKHFQSKKEYARG